MDLFRLRAEIRDRQHNTTNDADRACSSHYVRINRDGQVEIEPCEHPRNCPQNLFRLAADSHYARALRESLPDVEGHPIHGGAVHRLFRTYRETPESNVERTYVINGQDHRLTFILATNDFLPYPAQGGNIHEVPQTERPPYTERIAIELEHNSPAEVRGRNAQAAQWAAEAPRRERIRLQNEALEERLRRERAAWARRDYQFPRDDFRLPGREAEGEATWPAPQVPRNSPRSTIRPMLNADDVPPCYGPRDSERERRAQEHRRVTMAGIQPPRRPAHEPRQEGLTFFRLLNGDGDQAPVDHPAVGAQTSPQPTPQYPTRLFPGYDANQQARLRGQPIPQPRQATSPSQVINRPNRATTGPAVQQTPQWSAEPPSRLFGSSSAWKQGHHINQPCLPPQQVNPPPPLQVVNRPTRGLIRGLSASRWAQPLVPNPQNPQAEQEDQEALLSHYMRQRSASESRDHGRILNNIAILREHDPEHADELEQHFRRILIGETQHRAQRDHRNAAANVNTDPFHWQGELPATMHPNRYTQMMDAHYFQLYRNALRAGELPPNRYRHDDGEIIQRLPAYEHPPEYVAPPPPPPPVNPADEEEGQEQVTYLDQVGNPVHFDQPGPARYERDIEDDVSIPDGSSSSSSDRSSVPEYSTSSNPYANGEIDDENVPQEILYRALLATSTPDTGRGLNDSTGQPPIGTSRPRPRGGYAPSFQTPSTPEDLEDELEDKSEGLEREPTPSNTIPSSLSPEPQPRPSPFIERSYYWRPGIHPIPSPPPNPPIGNLHYVCTEYGPGYQQWALRRRDAEPVTPRFVRRPERLEEWVDSERVYVDGDGDGEGSSDEAVANEVLRNIERVRTVEIGGLYSSEGEGESESESKSGSEDEDGGSEIDYADEEGLEMAPGNLGRALARIVIQEENEAEDDSSALEPFPDFHQPSYTPPRQNSRTRFNNERADEQVLADIARIASYGGFQSERSLAREAYDALFDDEGNKLGDDNDKDGETLEIDDEEQPSSASELPISDETPSTYRQAAINQEPTNASVLANLAEIGGQSGFRTGAELEREVREGWCDDSIPDDHSII